MASKIENTKREPQIWKIGVETKTPQKIRIRVSNAKKPHSLYTNRYNVVNGKAMFYVRMPQTPDVALLEVYNEGKGNLPDGKDGSFNVFEFKKLPLETDYSIFDYNAKSKSFIKFLQYFTENASNFSAGQSIYKSTDGMFQINYLDTITDVRRYVKDKNGKEMPNPNFGREMKTPARINRVTGVIEVSKKALLRYSIPMRMIVLLHEVSHFYLNNTDVDEAEADFNALKIYLGLGYPRIEAINAFTEIFYTANTPLNQKRMYIIKRIVEDFEKKNNKIMQG